VQPNQLCAVHKAECAVKVAKVYSSKYTYFELSHNKQELFFVKNHKSWSLVYASVIVLYLTEHKNRYEVPYCDVSTLAHYE